MKEEITFQNSQEKRKQKATNRGKSNIPLSKYEWKCEKNI